MAERESALLKLPFELPERWLERIGYDGPDVLVGLYWGAGDELYVYDSGREWGGLHDHWAYLDFMRGPLILDWKWGHRVDLGSSDGPGTHHLIVDRQRCEAYVARVYQARRIVRRQRFDPEDFF